MSDQPIDPLFQQLDNWLAGVAAQLEPVERRKLTREVAIGLRKRQQKRIASQKNPDGSSYPLRRRRILRTQGSVRFLWHDEERQLRSWRTTGKGDHRAITGFDTERGGLRTFFKRDIQRYIEINLNQTTQNRTRKDPMFRRLRTAKFLKAYGTGDQAVVGFSGRAGEIASVNQYGEVDEIAPGVTAKYPVRELLGMSADDLDWLADTVVNHLQSD